MLFQEKVDLLLTEKANLLLSKKIIEDELDSLMTQNATLKDDASKETTKRNDVIKENKKTIKSFNLIHEDLNDKVEMINELEKTMGLLRLELAESREKLVQISTDLNLSYMTKEALEVQLQESLETNKSLQQYEMEVKKIKEEKTLMHESFQKLQNRNFELTSKTRIMEEQMVKMNNEELFSLKLECKEAQSKAHDVRERLIKAEELQTSLHMEKTRLAGQVNEERIEKEKLSTEYRLLLTQKDDVEKSLEILKEEKTSLMNDVSTNKQESYTIRNHLDNVHLKNTQLSANVNELSAQVEELKYQLREAEEKYKHTLSNTKAEKFDTLAEFKIELDILEKSKRKIENENADLVKKFNKATIQIKNAKLSFEEEMLKNQSNLLKFEEDNEELKEKHIKSIHTLKRELEDSEELRIKELDDNRRHLEKQHRSEIIHLSQEKADQIECLRDEKDHLTNELIKERQQFSDEMINIETNNQQALLMAQQELSLVMGQNKDLINQLDGAARENSILKKESSNKGETDRNYITDLQLGNSRNKFQIENMKEKYEVEKRELTTAYSNEKAQREEIEQQLNKLQNKIIQTEEKLLSVNEELEDARVKIQEAEVDRKSKLHTEIDGVDKKLMEARGTIHRLEKSRNELTVYNKALELEKLGYLNQMQTLEKRHSSLESELTTKYKEIHQITEDFEDIKEEHEKLQNIVAHQRSEMSTLKTDYQKLVEEHNDMLSNNAFENSRGDITDLSKISQLNLKILELENIKQSLEGELAAKTDVMSNEESISREKLKCLQMELEENILRAQKQEGQNRDLEVLLNESREDIKNLSLRMIASDKRIQELQSIINKKDINITEKETNIASIENILQQDT